MWAGDYTLSGLVGFEVRSKTIGVLGTGAIGAVACRIFAARPPAVLFGTGPAPSHMPWLTQCSWRVLLFSTYKGLHKQAPKTACTPDVDLACPQLILWVMRQNRVSLDWCAMT